jgi:hypothetical protein
MQEPLSFKRTSWTWSLECRNVTIEGISVCRKKQLLLLVMTIQELMEALFMYVSNTVGDLANGFVYDEKDER